MVKSIKVKLRKSNLLSDDEFKKLIDRDCKLLTSAQFAKHLQLKSDAALRKQRSKNRSLFPYAKIGNRVWYPIDLVVKTLHENLVNAQLR